MKQDTNMRETFPVETRVAAGLWRLATGNTYLSSGLQFGMGKSTAQNVSTEFENALAARRDEFIRFPTTHNEIQTTFQDRGNLTREDKKFNKKLCGLYSFSRTNTWHSEITLANITQTH